jgi:hypothetical protein
VTDFHAAPDTGTVAGEERLRQFVAHEPEPTPSVVLGWAVADSPHADTVAAWLRARRRDRRVRGHAVADGGEQ